MTNRAGKQNKSTRGMTLIEMIIAMTATVVIVLTAFSMVILGLRVYEKNRASMEDLNGMRTVLLHVSQDVRSYEGAGSTGVTTGSSGLILSLASSGSYYFQNQSIIRKQSGQPDQTLATGIKAFSAAIVQENGAKYLDVKIIGVNDENQLRSRFALR
jgi:type II secretory pathway pseudopilin PulG